MVSASKLTVPDMFQYSCNLQASCATSAALHGQNPLDADWTIVEPAIWDLFGFQFGGPLC